jgi:hypothetical protein
LQGQLSQIANLLIANDLILGAKGAILNAVTVAKSAGSMA